MAKLIRSRCTTAHIAVWLVVISVPLVFGSAVCGAVDLISSDSSMLGKTSAAQVVSLGDLKNFRVAGDKVIAFTGMQGGSDTKVSVLDVRTGVEKWSASGEIDYYFLSSGTDPVVTVRHMVGESKADVRVYDLRGNLLFTKAAITGGVWPSPNGKYFYTDYNMISVNNFVVFDRTGAELFSEPSVDYEWKAFPLNDSIVVYVSRDEFQFRSVPSGILAKSIPKPQDPHMSPLTVKVAKDGGWAILSWYKNVMCIGPDMDVKWTQTEAPKLLGSAFSEDNAFVALYQRSKSDHLVSLRRAATGEQLWSESIPDANSDFAGDMAGMQFVSGYVQVLNPQWQYLIEGRLIPEVKTLLYKVDPASGAVLNRCTVAGITMLGNVAGNVATVSCAGTNANQIALKEWTNEVADKK